MELDCIVTVNFQLFFYLAYVFQDGIHPETHITENTSFLTPPLTVKNRISFG